MSGKNVILGVTGGIAAYKACDLISGLRSSEFDVRVIMTEHAKEFITPLTLATLSRHPVMESMWVERNGSVEHIEVAKWADLFVVYPATANIIAKFANGIADDLLSTVYLALPKDDGGRDLAIPPRITEVFIFPAMNTNMLMHPATNRNVSWLRKDGCYVSDTRETELACGDVGKGALLKPKEALGIILDNI